MPYRWPKVYAEEEVRQRARSLALSVLRDMLWPLKDQPKPKTTAQYLNLAKVRVKAAELLVKLATSGLVASKRGKRLGTEGESYDEVLVELTVLDDEQREARIDEMVEGGLLPEAVAKEIRDTFAEVVNAGPSDESPGASGEAAGESPG